MMITSRLANRVESWLETVDVKKTRDLNIQPDKAEGDCDARKDDGTLDGVRRDKDEQSGVKRRKCREPRPIIFLLACYLVGEPLQFFLRRSGSWRVARHVEKAAATRYV